MESPSQGFPGLVAIFAVVGVLVVPLPISSAGARGGSSAGTLLVAIHPGSHALPAALRAPLSDRLGYIPGWQASVVDPIPAFGTIGIVVNLWPRDPAIYEPTARAISPLTPDNFRQQFAPSTSVYASYASYLEGFGLEVGALSADGLSFSAHGPAIDVGHAFGTTIETGLSGTHTVQFPSGPPTLPASLGDATAAIAGLASGWNEFSFSLQTARASQTLISPSDARDAYQLSGLYNVSGGPHWATGTQIAVVLWGDGYDPNDLATFFSQYYPSGFPQPHIFAYPVNGAPSPGPSAVSDPSMAPTELTLDLEWAGSMAPDSVINAVYGPDGPASNRYSPSDYSLETALSTAAGITGVDVVSMSFATSDGSDTSLQASFESTFASGTTRGITFVAASGDNGGTNGANGGCTTTADPQYPAASPQVLAVGGTAPTLSVSLTGTVNGIQSEPAWKDSGGGTSVDYPAPTWQPSGNRLIPDVAGPASSNFVYFGGQSEVGNGTSFAAPFWAGMLAEMDALRGVPLGNVAPRLYSIGAAEPNGSVAAGLVDITAGANCLASAGPGWDAVTGWGTPRAFLLYEDLNASYVNLNLTLGSGSVSPGDSLPVTVVVTNASSHLPLAGLQVTFTFTSVSGYVGPCAGQFSSNASATNSGGVTTSTLGGIPSCFLGSQAQVTATVLSGGYFGSSSATIRVNLVGLNAFLQFIQQYPYNYLAFALIMGAAIGIGVALSRRGARRKARRATRMRTSAPPVGATASVAPARTVVSASPSTPTESTGAAALPAAAGICTSCGAPLDPQIPFCARCGQYVLPQSPDGRSVEP